jgi:hypothetical protein
VKLNKNFKLPISSFAVEPSFDPERYTKMRIKVMHTGLNLNNTSFGMDSIERAKPTLSNIPLLAFIKSTDGEENADFDGHNFEIRVTEGELKYVYLGRPVGMIPETNNYEVVQEEDRTYVVVDGYIWNDYANQALDIIERDGGKSVSMEVSIDDYEDKGSYFEINNFKYTGIALLGEGVNPAMVGAKADLVKYSQDAVAEMMAQLKADLEAYAEKDNEEPAEDNAEENVEPAEDNTDENVEPAEDNTDENVEPAEDNTDENVEPAEDNTDENVEPEEDNANESAEEDVEPEEYNAESDVEPEEDNSEPEEDNSEPEADEDFEAKYNELKAEFEALKERNEELETFKAEFEQTQKQEKVEELFAKFEDLSGEEFEAIKDNALEFSLEDLETKLYAIRGRMMEEKPVANFSFSFNSGSKSKPKEPSWADLVRNRKK